MHWEVWVAGSGGRIYDKRSQSEVREGEENVEKKKEKDR
jgi:hypothetical protein